MEREDEFQLMNRLATFAGIAGPESQEARNNDVLWQRRVLRGTLKMIEAMKESSRSPGCSTTLREDYEKLKAAASCIHHWHDSSEDGMVVSAEHVRNLWTVLAEIQ